MLLAVSVLGTAIDVNAAGMLTGETIETEQSDAIVSTTNEGDTLSGEALPLEYDVEGAEEGASFDEDFFGDEEEPFYDETEDDESDLSDDVIDDSDPEDPTYEETVPEDDAETETEEIFTEDADTSYLMGDDYEYATFTFIAPVGVEKITYGYVFNGRDASGSVASANGSSSISFEEAVVNSDGKLELKKQIQIGYMPGNISYWYYYSISSKSATLTNGNQGEIISIIQDGTELSSTYEEPGNNPPYYLWQTGKLDGDTTIEFVFEEDFGGALGLTIGKFITPGIRYEKTTIDGMTAYVFKCDIRWGYTTLNVGVPRDATWEVYSERDCNEESRLENHTVHFDTSLSENICYIKLTNETESAVFMVKFILYDEYASVAPRSIPYYPRDLDDSISTKIDWGWELFNSDATGSFDNDIATASLVLSRDAQAGLRNIQFLLEGLGFDQNSSSSANYGNATFDIARPAYTLVYQKVNINDTPSNLFVVVVRGTGDSADVLTALSAQAGSLNTSKAYIKEQLEQYMRSSCGKTLSDIKNENNIFLITGHGLGGAVANLLAADLEEYAVPQNIFAYTFAAPATVNIAQAGGYPNIKNVLNMEDRIAWLIDNTNYGRLGQDTWFHRENDGIKNSIYSAYSTITEGKSLYEMSNVLSNANTGTSTLYSGHSADKYFAYLLSRPDAGEPESYAIKTRRVSFHCPVDVEVYSKSGVLLGRVVNNQIDDSIDSYVHIEVDGDEKYFYLLFDGEYEFKVIGNDSGVMTYDLEEVDPDTGDVTVIKEFSGVNIENDKSFITDVTTESALEDTSLFVIDENGKPYLEVNEDGTELPYTPIPEGLWIELSPNPDSEDGEYYYTGKQVKPEVKVYDNVTLLNAGSDYTIKYSNNTKAFSLFEEDAGFYNSKGKTAAPAITVTGKGNYAGTEVAYFRILPISIETSNVQTFCDSMSIAFNSKEQKPVPEMTVSGKAIKAKTDYDIVYFDADGYLSMDEPGKALPSVKNTGTYVMRLTGKGNYSGIRDVPLYVVDNSVKKLVTKLKFSKIAAQSYDEGKEIKPAITVKDGTKELVPKTSDEQTDYDYTLTYENNTKVGTGYVIVTGNPERGYSGIKRIAFKINGITLAGAKVAGMPASATYTATDITIDNLLRAGTIAVSPKGKDTVLTMYNPETGTGDYKVTYKNNKNVGTATVSFEGVNGYTGTFSKNFKILPCSLNSGVITVSRASEGDLPYEKGGVKEKVVITHGAYTLVEGIDYALSYTGNKNVGSTATITIKGKKNYKDTYNGKLSFKIVTQSISAMTIYADDKAYQPKKNSFTTTVKIYDTNGKQLAANTDYDRTFDYTYPDGATVYQITGKKKLNSYYRKPGDAVDKDDIILANTKLRVTIKGKNSYTGSIYADYRIIKSSISGAKVSVKSQVYTGNPIKLTEDDITVKISNKEVAATDAETGLKNWEIVPGSEKNNTNKGTATVQIRGLGNYGGVKTVQFKIAARGIIWWWRW